MENANTGDIDKGYIDTVSELCGIRRNRIIKGLAGFGILGAIVLNLSKLIVGIVFLHDCSIEEKIPIYLIVSALAPILFGGMITPGRKGAEKKCMIIFGILAGSINIIWIICGSAWVYPAYSKVNKDTNVPCSDTNSTYTECTEGMCNNRLLKTAVAMVTLDLITIVVVIFIVKYMVYKNRNTNPEPENPENTASTI